MSKVGSLNRLITLINLWQDQTRKTEKSNELYQEWNEGITTNDTHVKKIIRCYAKNILNLEEIGKLPEKQNILNTKHDEIENYNSLRTIK